MKITRVNTHFILTLLIVLVTSFSGMGQNYTDAELRTKLDSLSSKNPGLNNTVQLSVSGLALYEFVYSVALENNLNITIEPSLNQAITYNFFDAKVKDILVFLYFNFELEYEFTGSILAIRKRSVQKPKSPTIVTKQIDIKYNPANEFLSMNLQNDTLWKVVEKITTLTDKNFVISPEVRNKQVNAFFQNRPYEQVLEMFVKANGLSINKEKEGFYTIALESNQDAPSIGSGKSSGSQGKKPKTASSTDDFNLEKNKDGTVNVFANNVDLIEILKTAASELNAHYVLHSTVEGKGNLDLKNVTFNELIAHLFTTTKYNYTVKDQLYIIGERKMEGIRKSELIRLENRTVENVKTAIPKELLTDVDVSEFLELNGLIVSGSERAILELKTFLKSIDIVVPMIQIDIMLITSSRSNTVNVGSQAGIGTAPAASTEVLNQTEGLNIKLGAKAINALLEAISGFGVLNLGKVTDNFFSNLSALETNNVINIESTPKISTLNGQKASLSIGKTTYYQETVVNVSTSVTQQGVLQSKVWKSIPADLSVNIQPFVSADEQITLTIKVDQNAFAGKADPTSPPNMTTQKFESMVRVKNGELVLLGGLEEINDNKSGTGVPWLARIPVIKWIFSGRSNIKSKSKLHILIRPTVTY